MDIQKSREEFEKLPEIAKIIKEHDAFYCNKGEWYLCPDDDQFAEAYLDGAWYAFQEQQKKINEIKAIAESWINQDYTYNSDSTDIKIQQMKDCGRDIIQKINGE